MGIERLKPKDVPNEPVTLPTLNHVAHDGTGLVLPPTNGPVEIFNANGKPPLSSREQEVLVLNQRGLKTKEIARILKVSPGTIRARRRSIRIKTGAVKTDQSVKNDSFKGLSQREKQVLQLVMQGKRNKKIAEELEIKINTVRTHLRNIFPKLGIKRRFEVISITTPEENKNELPQQRIKNPLSQLTRTETKVLRLSVGDTLETIAKKLVVSIPTIKAHRGSIYSKLNVRDIFSAILILTRYSSDFNNLYIPQNIQQADKTYEMCEDFYQKLGKIRKFFDLLARGYANQEIAKELSISLSIIFHYREKLESDITLLNTQINKNNPNFIYPEFKTRFIAILIDHALKMGRSKKLFNLTPVEQDVMDLTLQGLSSRQIAEKLYIGEDLVAQHFDDSIKKINNAAAIDNKEKDPILLYLDAEKQIQQRKNH